MTDQQTDEMRRRLVAAYDDVMDEPVPARLTNLLREPRVIDIGAAREARVRSTWTWAHWGGMAASVLMGVLAGMQFTPRPGSLVVEGNSSVVAGPALARALDASLASETRGPVGVQLSFVDHGGRYCRTFTQGELAGLACRNGTRWSVVATAQAAPEAAGGMRQAATALPKPVLDAVDARIEGAALDASQERAARDRGWRH